MAGNLLSRLRASTSVFELLNIRYSLKEPSVMFFRKLAPLYHPLHHAFLRRLRVVSAQLINARLVRPVRLFDYSQQFLSIKEGHSRRRYPIHSHDLTERPAHRRVGASDTILKFVRQLVCE